MPRRADDFDDDYDDYDRPPPAYSVRDVGYLMHAGMGIASFVIGLGIAAVDVLMFIVALALVASPPARFDHADGETFGAVTVVVFCGGWVVALAGLGLGIGGLCQPERRRGLAIAGVILNSLVILVVLTIFLIILAAADRRGGFRF